MSRFLLPFFLSLLVIPLIGQKELIIQAGPEYYFFGREISNFNQKEGANYSPQLGYAFDLAYRKSLSPRFSLRGQAGYSSSKIEIEMSDGGNYGGSTSIGLFKFNKFNLSLNGELKFDRLWQIRLGLGGYFSSMFDDFQVEITRQSWSHFDGGSSSMSVFVARQSRYLQPNDIGVLVNLNRDFSIGNQLLLNTAINYNHAFSNARVLNSSGRKMFVRKVSLSVGLILRLNQSD